MAGKMPKFTQKDMQKIAAWFKHLDETRQQATPDQQLQFLQDEVRARIDEADAAFLKKIGISPL